MPGMRQRKYACSHGGTSKSPIFPRSTYASDGTEGEAIVKENMLVISLCAKELFHSCRAPYQRLHLELDLSEKQASSLISCENLFC